VLENVFDEDTCGIHCVLTTQTKSFTYHIKKGVATYLGEGDLHGEYSLRLCIFLVPCMNILMAVLMLSLSY